VHDHTDTEIVDRVRAGETAAFGELYDRYWGRLFGYCLRLLEDREKAKEVVQAAFVKALESIGSLERPELFSSWLFTIARNGVYGNFRAARKDGAADAGDDVSDTDTPHDRVVARETSALVEEGLGRLKPEYREVLVLRHFERLSYAEIAAITGATVTSVESRLFKARKALLKYLEPYVHERSVS
jgi:RNA polymerase sigma-70 factor (ECF subfamily)